MTLLVWAGTVLVLVLEFVVWVWLWCEHQDIKQQQRLDRLKGWTTYHSSREG